MKRILIVLGVLILAALAGVGGWWAVQKLRPPGPQPGPVVDEQTALLLTHFESKDDDKSLEAAQTLSQMGPKAVDPLRAKLKDKNATVRFWAVQSLAFMEPEVLAGATDDLLPLLKDSDANVRYKTVYALGRLDPKSDAVFVGIIGAMTDADDSVRDTAIEVVEKLDAPPQAAVPALVKMVGPGAATDVRRRVLPILAKAGEPAVPTFRAMLKNVNPDVGDEYPVLLHAVGLLGPHTKAVLPELQAVLAKTIPSPRYLEPAMPEALKRCGPEGATTMAEAVRSVQKEGVVHNNRLLLLHAIGSMGADAAVAVPILAEVLKNNTPKCEPVEYRSSILETLGNIGPSARDARPAIEALLAEPAMAQTARETLNRIGVLEKK